MEENRIETPLSEVDSNVNTVGDISTEEANQAANEVESTCTTCEASDNEAIAEAQEPMNFDFGMPLDPDLLRAYRAARRVGERRQVSKKENKKKKAKRRMAKKSKR
jgi:hypothetical protein